jgi:single-strand DNA-binding protein
MNKVLMMGRLTKDPEVRYTNGENVTAIARFSIAVDRRFKNNNGEYETDFFNCTAFGKQGEFAEKYLKKGTKIVLSGRIQNDNYTNRDGQKVTAVQIITEEIEFAESKKNEQPTEQQKEEWANIDNLDSEELPFNFDN